MCKTQASILESIRKKEIKTEYGWVMWDKVFGMDFASFSHDRSVSIECGHDANGFFRQGQQCIPVKITYHKRRH